MLKSAGEGQDDDIILTATLGEMLSFKLEPESDVVGAATTVLISWTLGNNMPAGAEFDIEIPIWN